MERNKKYLTTTLMMMRDGKKRKNLSLCIDRRDVIKSNERRSLFFLLLEDEV